MGVMVDWPEVAREAGYTYEEFREVCRGKPPLYIHREIIGRPYPCKEIVRDWAKREGLWHRDKRGGPNNFTGKSPYGFPLTLRGWLQKYDVSTLTIAQISERSGFCLNYVGNFVRKNKVPYRPAR